MHSELLIFAGTTEGRELAECLDQQGVPAHICVATDYGATLLREHTSIHQIHVGRLDAEAMAALIREFGIRRVVDATHPYAVEATRNIENACQQTETAYLRWERESISTGDLDETEETDTSDAVGNPEGTGTLDAVGETVATDKPDPVDVKESAGGLTATDTPGKEAPGIIYVSSVQGAVDFLKEHPGRVLATTGSSELGLYTHIPDYQNRIFARILSTAESMEIAAGLGFQGKNLICMQGPFSEELNIAMLRSVGADFLVTKESGVTGGFPEKVRAAKRTGVTLIVVSRPQPVTRQIEPGQTEPGQTETVQTEPGQAEPTLTETGQTKKIGEFAGELAPVPGGKPAEGSPEKRVEKPAEGSPGKRVEKLEEGSSEKQVEKTAEGSLEEQVKKSAEEPVANKRIVSLVGIGMGAPEGRTPEADRAIREADLIIGAERILESVSLPKDIFLYKSYLADDIAAFIGAHTECKRICVLLSGDVGFYSGAKKLRGLLDAMPDLAVRSICGISTPQSFCAKLGIPWEDVRLISLHGRKQNLVGAVARYPKVFSLVGKPSAFRDMCEELIAYGLGEVMMHVGSDLSLENERIQSGSALQALHFETGDLCAVLIENPKAGRFVTHGLEDGAFLRGQVPMTKSEVRAVAIAKLGLQNDSVLIDVGAGTGSVSIEAARVACDGMVWAVEKNPEAVALIRQNMHRLQTPNVQIVEGTAPEALSLLPAPTHAFIGGSSGNMREIIAALLEKNPKVRLVINAIAPETLASSLAILKEYGFADPGIVCVNIAKARAAGDVHLMMGQNPVYVIFCGG